MKRYPIDQIVDHFNPGLRRLAQKNSSRVQCEFSELETEYQSTLLKAAKKWNFSQSQFASWLFTQSRGRTLDLAKTSAKKPVLESLDLMERATFDDEHSPAVSFSA